jgi:hypothetical protein
MITALSKTVSDSFLKKWNGLFFEKSNLQDSGLRIQLGHGGAKCIAPTPGPSKFIVVDVTGIHKVAIDYCDCRTNGIIPHHIQLLRAGWFPATFICPQTAFTFHCLDFYHELTLQSKVNAYDFCRSLLRLTVKTRTDGRGSLGAAELW